MTITDFGLSPEAVEPFQAASLKSDGSQTAS